MAVAAPNDKSASSSEQPRDRSPKVDAIVAAAARVFLASGYDNASMDAIAAEAGVAKQTLYSHFGSKAHLFEAIIQGRCTALLGVAEEREGANAAADDTPAGTLSRAGRRFLTVILDPSSVALYRAVISESARAPELADAFYRAGPLRAVAGLAEVLRGFDATGALRVEDAEASAHLFYAMLRGDLHLRCLLGLSEADDADIDRWVAQAVSAFIAIHAPKDG